jgi:hypothetical protein
VEFADNVQMDLNPMQIKQRVSAMQDLILMNQLLHVFNLHNVPQIHLQ